MAHPVLQDLQAMLAILDLPELEEPLVPQALLAIKVHRVWPDFRDKVDLPDYKDSQDYKVGLTLMSSV